MRQVLGHNIVRVNFRIKGQIRKLSASQGGTPFYGEPRSPSRGRPTPSAWRNVGIAVDSAFTALSDPTRADAVAALGEVTGYVALTRLCETMQSDPTGKRILRDRPVVSKDTIPVDALIAEAEEASEPITFGQAYGRFLKMHGFDPDERDEVRYVQDPELAYVMLRYRQCHDFWHALTGLPPTVLGELGLKWLEVLQTGLPVAALSVTVGSLRLDKEERRVLNDHFLPWAIQVNDQVPCLMNVYYEEEFDTPLEELRERLGVVPAPDTGTGSTQSTS